MISVIFSVLGIVLFLVSYLGASDAAEAQFAPDPNHTIKVLRAGIALAWLSALFLLLAWAFASF